MNRLAQLRQLGLFDARVPRYTSYPTANHFSGDIGPDQTLGWIAAMPQDSEFSLYIHIPFCRRLCWFCACRTQGTKTAEPVAAYVETIKAELSHIAQYLPTGAKICHLHWGGGTPTLLSPEMITDLCAAIATMAPFSDDAEFSVEIDPNEIDEPRLDALVAAGMTRASIGVQDFDPDIQDVIGRKQSFEITRFTVDALTARGIGSLNMDILYGLPHQTPERLTASIQKVLSLNPDRVALFGYAHVPWMARRQALIPTDALPDPRARLELFETARQIFVWDGYAPIGIDHFARSGDSLALADKHGRLCRNFQGYTDDRSDVLIGVGASAISRFPQGFAQNISATSGYQKAIRNGDHATARGHAFTDDDRLRGAMIEALMCAFKIDYAAIAEKLAVPVTAIQELLEGIETVFPYSLARTPEAIEILPQARPLTRMIARYLDAYAGPSTGHSHAI